MVFTIFAVDLAVSGLIKRGALACPPDGVTCKTNN